MRWESGRRSDNVEDRRGRRVTRGLAGGGLGALILVVVAMLFGVDPRLLLQGVSAGGGETVEPYQPTPEEERLADFVRVVLGDTEDTWTALFQGAGGTYELPVLVLFSGAVRSACGFADAAVGPFYCPGDRKLYIDLSFYQEMQTRFGAPGDFAQAYVIAHEVGHHVQTLIGVADEVNAARQRVGQEEANALSVRQELQADCFAGVWAHHAQRVRNVLEQGDLEEALTAAAAIGDDRLQRQAQGYVVPETFTHGTSEQRVRWFREGFRTGDTARCDTFQTPAL
ncbi:MAG TPA: neutral zinc metallopeptidase [Gemmatimonadales bacterium]|jgi:predicted metalloprotease|nr:neutral zinc metallopeptidase [Gemmatimonadales bacterium]